MSLTNVYCDPQQVKDAVLAGTYPADDAIVDLAVLAASRQIDGYCGQRFWLDASPVAREFYVGGDGRVLSLWQDDVSGIGDTTGLVVATDPNGTGTFGTMLTVNTDYLLLPRNAAVSVPARPYTQIVTALNGSPYGAFPLTWAQSRPTVRVTAKWGWPAVPDEVQQACLLQALQLWKAKDAPFGVTSFGDIAALRVKAAIHPIAEALLQPYVVVGVG